MNDRNHNGNPTFVFKTSKIALQVGVDIDKESGHFLSECYDNFDGNEKRVTKMTVLTISVYHPLLKRQCVLATMDCEEQNFQNSKMFWNCWNTALQEHSNKPSYTFSPTGIILDERGCNWKALEEGDGKEFVELCSSCEFHFKQRFHRRGKKAYFSSEDCISKFIYNSKQILEAQTWNQFEDAVNEWKTLLVKMKKGGN